MSNETKTPRISRARLDLMDLAVRFLALLGLARLVDFTTISVLGLPPINPYNNGWTATLAVSLLVVVASQALVKALLRDTKAAEHQHLARP